MPLPTVEELTTEFALYVSTPSANNTFVGSSVQKAVDYILGKVGTEPTMDWVDGYYVPVSYQAVPMPTSIYKEEVMELAADLFYRRQAQNGVASVNAMEGTVIRVARDPYKGCDERLIRWAGLGFA